MKKLLFVMMLGIIAVFTPVFGQETEAQRARREQETRALEQKAREREQIMRKENAQQQLELEDWARRKERENLRFKTKPLSKEELKMARAALEPNPEDLVQYKDFLQQSKTGLFRLIPNRGCSLKYVVSANEECQNSTYFGEFYSFELKDYYNSGFFDLTYKDGELISEGDFSHKMLVTLGDVPIEDISLVSNGVKFLKDFEPQTENNEFEKKTAEIAIGINFDGYKYSKSAKALPDTTYALRVVAYSPQINSSSWYRENEAEFLRKRAIIANSNKRSDLILVFRIIRQDPNGTLSILWKELSRKKSHKLTFPKDKLRTDINKMNLVNKLSSSWSR